MKCLLDFVACCVQCKTEPAAASASSSSSAVEESSLVPTPRKSDRRRKRRPSVGGEEWKPSLTSISEDYVGASAEKVHKERRIKRMAAAAAAAHEDAKIQHAGGRCNDHGRASFSTILPTFVPAPFMF